MSEDGNNYPVHLLSRQAVSEGRKSILILAAPGTKPFRATEMVLESARQLLAGKSVFGDAHVDLLPLVAPGRGINRSVPDRARNRMLHRVLERRKYDLVIVHRVDPDQVGFVIAQKGNLADEAMFAQSRVRDHGYFVGSGDEQLVKKIFRRNGLPDFLTGPGRGAVMVLSSWQGEEQEKAVHQHLLAQETIIGLLLNSFYQ
ncbi:hypothetical protein [Emcibacter sp.]|uniref:hypothetical protein n=1 Tax=Emcibacter sp. TaxID=1979954 RepID=UPI003A94BB1F